MVFHCQLSQQRGPSCAAAYYRHNYNSNKPEEDNQEIYVLTGGFSEWAREYGKDKNVTENFKPQLYCQF